MEEFFIKLIQSYGFWSAVGIVVVLVLWKNADRIIELFYRWLEKRLGLSKEEIKVKDNIEDKDDKVVLSHEVTDFRSLRSHIVFKEIDSAIMFQIDKIDLNDEARNLICHDALKIMMGMLKEKLYDLCKEDVDTALELYKKNIDIFENTMRECELRYYQEKMPEIFIKKFKDWQLGRFETIINMVTEITSDDMPVSLPIMYNNILFMYTFSIQNIMKDAVMTLRSINGKLTGEKYKGKVVIK